MNDAPSLASTPLAFIQTILAQLAQTLPVQPPLALFTYQNPLQKCQHLPFEQAVATQNSSGYLSEAQFRALYRQGHITDTDIAAAFAQDPSLQAQNILLSAHPAVTQAAVYRLLMLFDLEPVLPSQLAWQIEELNTLEKFQPDIPIAIRQQLLGNNPTAEAEKKLIGDLWQTLLNKLNLEENYLHPENMLDLSLDQAEALLAQYKAAQRKVSLKKSSMHERMQEAAVKTFATEVQRLGSDMTLRHLIMSLCGIDILDNVRPQMARICSSGLDEGMAAWTLPERNTAGLYGAWRLVAGLDINPFLQELPDWHAIIAELPDTPEAAIVLQLTYFEIPQTQWSGYLHCLSLEMSGWTGIINWRAGHPDYQPNNDSKPTVADFLAIRLTLDRLWLNQICRNTWACAATLSSLRAYFRKNASEYMVRWHLYQGNLPEHLIQQAEALTLSVDDQRYNRTEWQNLADIIWTWQGSRMTSSRPQHSIYDSAWLLFCLSQHLGLSAEQLQIVSSAELEQTLKVLRAFTNARRSHTWLLSYEHHYRENLLQALPAAVVNNQHNCPAVQFIFSMDHREESLRRWLEGNVVDIETFGIPGFITAPETSKPSPSISPSKRYAILSSLWYHTQWGNLFVAPLLMTLATPFILGNLLAKVFAPRWQQACSIRLRQKLNPPFVPHVDAAIHTDTINQLAQLFHTIGLTQHFGRVVILMGHTSSVQNNSHYAAFTQTNAVLQQDGMSAAAMAALINSTEVRAALIRAGIHIPPDTYFISAEHNTTDESITWHSFDTLPEELQAVVKKQQIDCLTALQKTAQERCRGFTHTPQKLTGTEALQIIRKRSTDFAERQQEPAYANAIAAVIGRRQLTQKLMLNRNAFLISYDPPSDPSGKQLEALLLTIMPTLSALNLTYYFAKVDHARFGSGDSLQHNVVAQLGVMEGTCSDLRYGLPQHMVKHHAAMRLHLVVETLAETLQQILERNPTLQQLVQNHWLTLSTRDPESPTPLTQEQVYG